MNGILLVNKRKGLSTYDIIREIKSSTRLTEKIGHTGTLDPMATGLVIVCVGQATRISQFLIGMDKEYAGEITLGAATDTYDAMGKTVSTNTDVQPTIEEVREVASKFIGEIRQMPPAFSAIRKKGKRLYEHARQGGPFPEIEPRTVTIHRFDLLDYRYPLLGFRAFVGSGTYIRSLAHDMGKTLGCGAHLSALNRTKIGDFSLDTAIDTGVITSSENPYETLEALLRPIREALGYLPVYELSDEHDLKRISNGNSIMLTVSPRLEDRPLLTKAPFPNPVLIIDKTINCAIAVAQLSDVEVGGEGQSLKPRIVFG